MFRHFKENIIIIKHFLWIFIIQWWNSECADHAYGFMTICGICTVYNIHNYYILLTDVFMD